MDISLMKAALWRFTHRPRDWRRITAWTLVVCMTLATAAGTVSRPTFTGDALATVPPYLVVAMWQRTA